MSTQRKRKCARCGAQSATVRSFPSNAKAYHQRLWVNSLGLDEQASAMELDYLRSRVKDREDIRWCEKHFDSNGMPIMDDEIRDPIFDEIAAAEQQDRRRTWQPAAAAVGYRAPARMDALKGDRLKEARFLASCVVEVFQSKIVRSMDELTLWKLGKNIVNVIDHMPPVGEKADCSGLYEMCEKSKDKTQIDRLSAAICALLIHMLKERERNYQPECSNPDDSTVKEEQYVDWTTSTKNPAASADEVKTESVEVNSLEGWEKRTPPIEPPLSCIQNGSRKRNGKAPLEAAVKEVPTGAEGNVKQDATSSGIGSAAADTVVKEEHADATAAAAGEAVVKEEEAAATAAASGEAIVKEEVEDEEYGQPVAPKFDLDAFAPADDAASPIKQEEEEMVFDPAAVAGDGMEIKEEELDPVDWQDTPSTSAASIEPPAPKRFRVTRIMPAAAAAKPGAYKILTVKPGVKAKEVNYRNGQSMPSSIVTKNTMRFECASCDLNTSNFTLWNNHMSRVCPLCHRNLPICLELERHWTNPPEALKCSTKCPHKACDYRSMEKEFIHHHERTHWADKNNRKVSDLKIDAKCPYCPLHLPFASTFINHMVECHSNLIPSTPRLSDDKVDSLIQSIRLQSRVMKCNGYGSSATHGICLFRCSRTHEMIRHWEKNDARHGLPSISFDYEEASDVASQKRREGYYQNNGKKLPSKR
ncbi:hypothetical protein PMAYCL1PPCAC_05835 [Pristionchus mayeri]|uniref:Uncharacterized protein n=1 Tax=Pristionchus mayeri TaxID=1317129 RepID=A0AAN4ZES4_9BILA|nr:hypothetical protein PMAYCL1PPCAC_05835 [Pristionchus mayeri]